MQAKKKKEEIEDEERSIVYFYSLLTTLIGAMAQVDWNDFVIVETIDLFDAEDLPAPTNFSEIEKY